MTAHLRGTHAAPGAVLMYLWLMSAIVASYLSDRKGYGDRPGLATGLILSILGTIIWLFVPAPSRTRSGSSSALYGGAEARAVQGQQLS